MTKKTISVLRAEKDHFAPIFQLSRGLYDGLDYLEQVRQFNLIDKRKRGEGEKECHFNQTLTNSTTKRLRVSSYVRPSR